MALGVTERLPPYGDWLAEVEERVRATVEKGRVQTRIPALSNVNPRHFGCALATADGTIYGVGDYDFAFSIQSISKVFSLMLVLSSDPDRLWKRVGRRPADYPFDSVGQLERENGIPCNPFVNAGALVVTDELISLRGDAGEAICEFLRTESGNSDISYDPNVAASEAEVSHRNAALAHLLADYGNLRNDVDTVLSQYFRQCAITMTCADLARSAGILARHGTSRDGVRMLTRSDAKRVNAVMMLCGAYGAAGEFAFRVGLPSKGGVGGGILAVVPERCTICVWAPGLDEYGNSVAATAALDAFTTISGWSVF